MQDKKNLGLIVVTIGVIIAAVGGAAFAYYTAQIGDGTETNINATSETTDSLMFEVGEDISITANQDDFGENKGNKQESTTAKAILKANSTTKTASRKYNLYLNITKNELNYTTKEQLAELVVSIKKPDGNTYLKRFANQTIDTTLTINQLNKETEMDAIDITNVKGLIPIALNYSIEANPETTQEWEVTITLINLSTEQNKNGGKSFNASLVIQEEPISLKTNGTLADVCSDGSNFAECLDKYQQTYTYETTHLLRHDAILENGANDASIRFTGGDYKVAVNHLETYPTIYDIISIQLDNGDIHKNNYWWGDNRNFYLVYSEETKAKTLRPLLAQAMETGYIQKNDINNYVCFGSSDDDCPKENLYRIIGVFNNQVKLIKAGNANKNQLGIGGSYYDDWGHDITYIGDSEYIKSIYYWNKDGAGKQAIWAESPLNTVNLNTNFVNYLKGLDEGTSFAKIATTLWQVGGMTNQNGCTKGAKTTYSYELGKNSITLTIENPIGLMYVSDYYYSAEPEFWILMGHDSSKQDVSIDKNVDYRGAIWNNWLYGNDTEWTITPRTEYSTGGAFFVSCYGRVFTYNVATSFIAVRPCFYLNANVTYKSGIGSIDDPFRIN